MLLNGLGFTARTLHMLPEFHADKPLDKLIRPGIEPENINEKEALNNRYLIGNAELYKQTMYGYYISKSNSLSPGYRLK